MLDLLNWLFDAGYWLLFDAGSLAVPVNRRYWFGLIATLASVALAAYFAKEVKRNQRLLTALALYAGAMAAIASVYDGAELSYRVGQGDVDPFKLPDRASNLASFIFVFAGTILAWEGGEEHWFVNWLQGLAVTLLVAVVIPRHFPIELISQQRAELMVGGALNLLGFLALGLGASSISKSHDRKLFATLAFILVVYAGFDVVRTAHVIIGTERQPMSVFFISVFAVAKILLTITLGFIVLRYHHAQQATHASAGPVMQPAQRKL